MDMNIEKMIEKKLKEEMEEIDRREKYKNAMKNPEQREEEAWRQVNILLDGHKLFKEKHQFKVGDIVTWKSEALRNARFPEEGFPAIVTGVLDEPRVTAKDSEIDNKTCRIHDIECMVMDCDGDLEIFPYDSRRLKPFGV